MKEGQTTVCLVQVWIRVVIHHRRNLHVYVCCCWQSVGDVSVRDGCRLVGGAEKHGRWIEGVGYGRPCVDEQGFRTW